MNNSLFWILAAIFLLAMCQGPEAPPTSEPTTTIVWVGVVVGIIAILTLASRRGGARGMFTAGGILFLGLGLLAPLVASWCLTVPLIGVSLYCFWMLTRVSR